MTLLRALPDTTENRRRELALQIALGRGLIDIVGSGSDEGYAAFQRARALCRELDESDSLLQVLYGLQVYHFAHSRPDIVIDYAHEILALGNRTGDRRALLLGERVAGSAYLLLGQFEKSRISYENLLQLYDPEMDGGVSSDTSRDPRVAGYSFLSICLTVMGYPDRGKEAAENAMHHADGLRHAISMVFGLRRTCIQHMLMRDVPLTLRRANQLLTLSATYETFKGEPEGTLFETWAILSQSHDSEAHKRMLLALDALDTTGNWALLPYVMGSAADLTARHGDINGAIALLNRAAELVRLSGERWCEPEILRLCAQIRPHSADERIALLRESLTLAREQGAKLWELRSATDLARIWSGQGLTGPAHDLLAPLCAWFSDAGNLPDVVDARVLAESLSQAAA